MTGAEDRPSFLPDTLLPTQDDPATDVGANAPRGVTPPADGVPSASGVGEWEEVESFPPRADGWPRTRIVVRPWPERLVDAPDEATSGGAKAAEPASSQAQSIDGRETEPT